MSLLKMTLRTADGQLSVNLADTTKYRFPRQEWQPMLAMPMETGYSDVTEAWPLEVLGATPSEVMINLNALIQVLSAAELWRIGASKTPVLLDYTAANVYPQRVMTAVLRGWDSSGFLAPDYLDTIPVANYVAVNVAVVRSGEWYHTGYYLPQLASGTAWSTNPSWSASGGTLSYTGSTETALFAQGYLTHSNASAGGRVLTSASGLLSVTSGQTYTIYLRVALLSGSAVLTCYLQNSAASANISTVPANQAVTGSSVASEATSGWLAFNVTATATDAAARLAFTVTYSGGAGSIRWTEVLIVAGNHTASDEKWHPTYSEATVVTSTAAASNGVVDVTFQKYTRPSRLLAPVAITLNRASADTVQETAYLLHTPQPPYYTGPYSGASILVYDWTGSVSAPWSTVADAANQARGGDVKRFTPVSTSAITQYTNITFSRNLYGRVLAFVCLRNNSASSGYFVKLEYCDAIGTKIGESNVIYVDAAVSNPLWYPLGLTALPNTGGGANTTRIVVQPTAAAGSLDADAFAFLELVPGAGVIKTDSYASGFSYNELVYDPQPLTDHAGAVKGQSSGLFRPALTYYNNVNPKSAITEDPNGISNPQTGRLAALLLFCRANYWQATYSGGSTIVTHTLTATQIPVSLTGA